MVLDKCGDVSQLHYADRKHTQLRNTRKLKAWLRAGKTVELRERDKVTCCWPLNSFLLRCILYIMKRTQLYLDEDIWKALHIRSRENRTSISELVRQAVRDRYGSSVANRSQAMAAFVGIWKDRDDLPNARTYIRRLRRGKRQLLSRIIYA